MNNNPNFCNYNKITISGKIIKNYPIKKTLNNKEVQSFILQHESMICENSTTRKVKCRLYCIFMNEDIILREDLLERNVILDGFMNQNANGNLVLYVKQIKFYKGL